MSVEIYSSGALVSSDDVITSAVLEYGGNNSMYVSNGGTANSTTVKNGGELYVLNRGKANIVAVSNMGNLYVSSGGVASSVVVTGGGFLNIHPGGKIKDVTLQGDEDNLVTMGVFDGNVISSVIRYGSMDLHGGSAQNVDVVKGGEVNVNAYSDLTSATISQGGLVTVRETGVVNSVNIINDGYLYVSSGGTATNTTINSRGSMYVSNGGIANKTTVNSGYLHILDGGIANSTMVNYYGFVSVFKGGVVTSSTVNNYGCLYIFNGGLASNSVVNSGGDVHVSSGGKINNTTVNSIGDLYIFKGGTANNIILNSSGNVYISLGGIVNNITLNNGGSLCVDMDIAVNSATINYGGYLSISSRGKVTQIKENGGHVYIDNGANVTFVENTFRDIVLNEFKTATVHSKTTAINTMVNNGYLRVYREGTANSTTVNSSGNMFVSSGGAANSVTVNGGVLYIESGGTVNNTTLNMGGSMYVSSGGRHRGILEIAYGAVVSSYKGSIIDLTVANRTTGDNYLINDLSKIMGTPTYNITVNANQEFGTYKLAQGAENFTGTLSIGTETTNYGTITVNGNSFAYNNINYSLIQENGNLTLKIDGYSPVEVNAPIVSANITSLTNKNVILTAKFNTDSITKKYKIGNGSWQDYIKAITISSNTVVTFKSTDNGGKEYITTYNVTNIDKIAPIVPKVSANKVELTDSSVIVNAIFSEDSAIKEYSFDVQNWFTYTTGIEFTKNGIIYFRGHDVAGNISEVVSYEVTNIRTATPLDLPIVTANTVAPTNKNVVLTAEFDSASTQNSYRINNGAWQKYLGSITINSNATVTFCSINEYGKEFTTVYVVDNIDKKDPEEPIVSADKTDITNKPVLVTAVFSSDSVVKEYSFDQKTWFTYADGVTMLENGSVYFRSQDAAGNISNIAEYKVDNIFIRTDIIDLDKDNEDSVVIEFSNDKFTNSTAFEVSGNAIEVYAPSANWQYKVENSSTSYKVDTIKQLQAIDYFEATENGVADIFLARTNGVWGSLMRAEYQGSADVEEKVILKGKNKICDIFVGSDDSNILFLTNDSNGDALFIDDIYSASFDNIGESNSRLAQIKEIQAGDGDDIIDLTSNKFDYSGSEMTIYGGSGNDIIWANDSVDNVIHGGLGDDTLVGGSQANTFVFEANWGNDVIYCNGTVTLNFIGVEEGKLITSDNTISYNGNTITLINFENQDYSITCSQLA